MTMPAGTYYIGDLCYVMHDAWDEFCDITIDGTCCCDGEFTLKDGRRFATYGTAFGDGTYTTSTGATLGVDAGLIGCILVSDIKDPEIKDLADIVKYGTTHHFDHEFETDEDEGVITFGGVYVNTGDDVSDDGYDDYFDENDDE
jgi:hypothetical protein